jgi:uncharacterized protein with PIN domain
MKDKKCPRCKKKLKKELKEEDFAVCRKCDFVRFENDDEFWKGEPVQYWKNQRYIRLS